MPKHPQLIIKISIFSPSTILKIGPLVKHKSDNLTSYIKLSLSGSKNFHLSHPKSANQAVWENFFWSAVSNKWNVFRN